MDGAICPIEFGARQRSCRLCYANGCISSTVEAIATTESRSGFLNEVVQILGLAQLKAHAAVCHHGVDARSVGAALVDRDPIHRT